MRQRLSWPGEEVTARSLTHRGITERGLAVQEQLAYRTVCMRQRHRVSSESPPNAAIPEGIATVTGGDVDGLMQWRSEH